MTIALILIYCVPVGLIVLVCFAIGAAAARTYRAGKRAYADVKPYVDHVSQQVARVQQKSAEFADRGQKLSESFEEISGRWAFITETLTETKDSPIVKLADIAGRFT